MDQRDPSVFYGNPRIRKRFTEVLNTFAARIEQNLDCRLNDINLSGI